MARKGSTTIPDEELDFAPASSYAPRWVPMNLLWTSACSISMKRPSRRFCAAKNACLFAGSSAAQCCRPGSHHPAARRSCGGTLRVLVRAAALRHIVLALPRRLQRQHRHLWDEQCRPLQILDAMASDIDRNIFFVPLELRKKQLEQIPWVQSAAIMRLLPNRLKIVVSERTPVAFVEVDSHIEMIDANGVIMEMPANPAHYSFPVIVGVSDNDPLSVRAARMKIFTRFMHELDSSGAHYSANISDVDLSDPDDVRATVTDPHGAVLVHLGSSNFLEHFQVYVTHVQEWRTQFPKLESVDLRYDHQVIVNPDSARETAKPNPVQSKSEAAPESKQATEHKKPASKAKAHVNHGKPNREPAYGNRRWERQDVRDRRRGE